MTRESGDRLLSGPGVADGEERVVALALGHALAVELLGDEVMPFSK